MPAVIAGLGAWLAGSSVALVLSAAAAALWCACAQRSRASVRYAVWLGTLGVTVLAPALAAARTTLLGGSPEGRHGGPLVLPLLSSAAIVVWGLGVLVVLSRLIVQHIALRRWARTLAPFDPPHSADLLGRHCHRRGRRSPRVVRGEVGAMPICWGIVCPRIMLPADASVWTDELKGSVLRHELAHIERHDALSDLLARIVVALLWFHPAAWLVNARIRIERERSCDERVVGSGIDPVSYAEQLLTLARAARSVPLSAAAMASRGDLEDRIAALLVAHGRRYTLGHGLAIAAAVAVVAIPATFLTPSVRVHPVAAVSPTGASQLPGGHPGSFRATLFGGGR